MGLPGRCLCVPLPRLAGWVQRWVQPDRVGLWLVGKLLHLSARAHAPTAQVLCLLLVGWPAASRGRTATVAASCALSQCTTTPPPCRRSHAALRGGPHPNPHRQARARRSTSSASPPARSCWCTGCQAAARPRSTPAAALSPTRLSWRWGRTPQMRLRRPPATRMLASWCRS